MSQLNNNFKRELKTTARTIFRPDPGTFGDDPLTWLKTQAKTADFAYLLAHADDGIIWGKVADETISLASDHFDVSPPLRATTLQQVRLFGPTAELYLWRNGSGWQARLITDGEGENVTCFDEHQILWGSKRLNGNGTFTLVVEGEQGHQHAIPIDVPGEKFANKNNPLRLWVRHYLTEDESSGQLRITLSRLVDVKVEESR